MGMLYLAQAAMKALLTANYEVIPMAKMFDELMQGMQKILEFEQGHRILRIDKICVPPELCCEYNNTFYHLKKNCYSIIN